MGREGWLFLIADAYANENSPRPSSSPPIYPQKIITFFDYDDGVIVDVVLTSAVLRAANILILPIE